MIPTTNIFIIFVMMLYKFWESYYIALLLNISNVWFVFKCISWLSTVYIFKSTSSILTSDTYLLYIYYEAENLNVFGKKFSDWSKFLKGKGLEILTEVLTYKYF